MHVTCEKCLYWEPPSEVKMGGLGECRRNPPVHEFWPVTLPTDWCGLAVPRDAGGAMAVHEAAQAVVDEWYRPGHGPDWLYAKMGPLVDALIETLRRMRP